MSEAKEKFRDLVLQEANKGNVVFKTFEGDMVVANLDEFVKQPIEGLLYDLNRDKATILTFINDPKWVNDFAVSLVIGKLKDLLEEAKPRETNTG